MDTRLQLYLKYLRLKRECAAYVRANDVRIAGDAMNRLNRVAYHAWTDAYRKPIYTLKNALVKLWYQRGYAQGVQLQTQTQTCWRCGGDGIDPYERDVWYTPGGERMVENDCIKCDGTGIWRQHRLYAFDFNVGGYCYRWHQPASQVGYTVTPTCAITTEYKREVRTGEVEVIDLTNAAMTEVDYCIVLEYLRWQGVPSAELHELMTAREVVGKLWKSSRLYGRWWRVRQWVGKWLPKREVEWVDIPF